MKQKTRELLGFSSESEESSSLPLELVIDKTEGKDDKAGGEGGNIYDFDLETAKEKPWLLPGANLADYFNYGFTEQTWKTYCDLQRENRKWAKKRDEQEDIVNERGGLGWEESQDHPPLRRDSSRR